MYRETYWEIKARKFFYRDYYRRLIRILLVSLVIILLLVVAIVYNILTRPEIIFYATNSEGFVIELNPLDQPNQSPNYLLEPDPPGIEAVEGQKDMTLN
ncbi:MAG: hypothetical protein Tsb005_15350 [Gammaproteobacteria bacterium]